MIKKVGLSVVILLVGLPTPILVGLASARGEWVAREMGGASVGLFLMVGLLLGFAVISAICSRSRSEG